MSGEGPILPPFVPESDLGLALVFALAAKFLALSVVFLAADLVAALALDAVAFALAGAFFAAALALAGAALAACFAAVAVFLVAAEALSNFLLPLRLSWLMLLVYRPLLIWPLPQ